MVGSTNHVGIDRRRRCIRRFTLTDAARHEGAQLGAVLGPDHTASGVGADTAQRRKANPGLLRRRGLKPQRQRARPQRRPMPDRIARGFATRRKRRALVEQGFATGKRRMGLVVRGIGPVRASARITRANLACSMRRLAGLAGRAVAA